MALRKDEYIAKYGEEAWAVESKRRNDIQKKSYRLHADERRAYGREYSARYRKENKEKVKETGKKYYEKNKEKVLEKVKEYVLANKEKVQQRHKEYYEKYKDVFLEQAREYRITNKDKIKEYRVKNREMLTRKHREYCEKNKERIQEYMKIYNSEFYKNYYSNKEGKSAIMAYGYKRSDKIKGFDTEKNVTPEWIQENIFNGQKCIYCGDSDWTHLGCDRIDNTKGHTPDNIVCACGICNAVRRDRYSVEEFIEYRKTHPRDLSSRMPKSFDLEEQNGVMVLKKPNLVN